MVVGEEPFYLLKNPLLYLIYVYCEREREALSLTLTHTLSSVCPILRKSLKKVVVDIPTK